MTSSKQGKKKLDTNMQETGLEGEGLESSQLKDMLMTLIEKGDFLMEEDLSTLMSVLPQDDKMLLKVDTVLGALGVSSKEDILGEDLK